MEIIADGLLVIAAVVASLYCLVLSRRLRQLTQTDDGIGKAIAAMSAQVGEMNAAMARAKKETAAAAAELDSRLVSAKSAAARVEAAVRAAGEAVAAAEAANVAPPPAAPKPAPRVPVAPPPRRRAAARKPAAKPVAVPERELAGPAVEGIEAAVGAALSAREGEDPEALARRLISALSGEAVLRPTAR